MIALLGWDRAEGLVYARQVLHPKLLEHFLKDGNQLLGLCTDLFENW